MYKLFIGDNNIELAEAALKNDPSAKLLDLKVYENEKINGSYYTSLADFNNIENFFNLCINSSEIFYFPPVTWSDADQNNNSKSKEWTETILYYCQQFINVTNLNITNREYLNYFSNKDRKTSGVQLWVAGCSITEGIGVLHDQTWKEHVSRWLHLDYIDLSKRGSSITWSADRLLRSDIRKNDIVLWQLTGHLRNFAIDEKTNKLYHLLPGIFDHANIKQLFPMDYIDSKTTICKNILSIQQVYNFCKKVEAKLVILGTLYDQDNNYIHYNVPCFEQMLVWPMQMIDKGTDNLHPGPKQHKLYAKKFIELLKKHYKDIV